MKKTKGFFMTLFVAITLFGFTETSLAFDLSYITERPIQFIKYMTKWLGFGDDDNKPLTTESDNKPQALEESDEEVNHSGDNWYLKDGSGADDIYAPVDLQGSSDWIAFNSLTTPSWLTKMEYQTALPFEYIPLLNIELTLKSSFSRQQFYGQNGEIPAGISDTFSLNTGNLSYGLGITIPVNEAVLGLYGWHGGEINHLTPAFYYLDTLNNPANILLHELNSDYYEGNNNLAAALSYKLPFMSFFHQGISPTVRVETAYRFGTNDFDYWSIKEDYDQWIVGISYEGNNNIDWLQSSMGINWGVGYNYAVPFNDRNNPDYMEGVYPSHLINVNASTYFNNLKIYSMFMYIYESRNPWSMMVLNATYSPGWRWSYGIKANFYYGRKNQDYKSLNSSETVTFTATYRWD